MEIQKPTVLDAARLTRELNQLEESKITGALRNQPRTALYLKLENPVAVLVYRIERKFSCLGLTDTVPLPSFNIMPALIGYRLISAEQINKDRIIELSLEKEDRLGRKRKARLIFELIPGIGNTYFTDDSRVIKGSLRIKEVPTYIPPKPLKKPSILNIGARPNLDFGQNVETLSDELYGLSRRDILNLSRDLKSQADDPVKLLQDYAERAARPGPGWTIVEDDLTIGYSLVEPSLGPREAAVRFKSALLMYEAYYGQAAKEEAEGQQLESLLNLLRKEIDRQDGKIDDLTKALAETVEATRFKRYGELLLASIGQIERGSKKARLKSLDGSSPEYVEIELDPARSPAANAAAYFKKYKKSVASVKILKRRLESAVDRRQRLRVMESGHGGSPEVLERELIKNGIIRGRVGAQISRKTEKRKPYRSYRASCGWEIMVGRSNADNDELTFKIAAKHDVWLHAWQAAGSHTVLRLPTRNSIPDKRTLQEAASLAAYFSKARSSSKVPVIYAQVRYVRKPRKFPPGKVLVEREKQLMVKPADPDDFLRGQTEYPEAASDNNSPST